MNPAEKRLLDLARAAEEGHLAQARGAVLRQFQDVNLKAAEKAIKAALSLPRAQRPAALRGALQLVSEATRATRTPPAELGKVIRAAVRDRVLNAEDLAALQDPKLAFNDSRELQAAAVTRQREVMNTYWTKESRRFRNDVAAVIRDAARRGLTPDQAADLLQKRLGVHRSRAVTIAKDQLLTVAELASQKRQRELGFTHFRWHSQGDRRVRTEHQRLAGRVFSYRTAPKLPGQDILCRCWAVPVKVTVSRPGAA